uniref:Matrix metallopeptidase 20b (enamelysin) n=1 Tax=Xiphophorus maculatus TaxID=8083 RepID=A0A3B5QR95_XIPMA
KCILIYRCTLFRRLDYCFRNGISSICSQDFLRQYYNLVNDHLVQMQMFFGLNSTGVLDSETLQVMQSPRCGVPDVEEYSHIQGTRWNKNVLTYRYCVIGRYTRDLRSSIVDSLIESAFSVWARASGLTFVRTHSHNADIMVEFVTYAHGDFYPFDGPRGTLAHAFGPGIGTGGDTHFDDDERWTAGGAGYNLFVVAAHEFGHALGLRHSRNPESLMYPTYKAFHPTNLLSREDVANIKALYSKLLLFVRF